MPISAKLKWLHISSLWVYRILTWAVLAAGFVFAAIVLSLRYWVLPNIEQYRGDIAQAISQAAHQRVTIGKISGNWDGIRPELVLENITLFDAANQPALELSRVDNTLSWLSLLTLDLRFHELEIHRPVLNIRRDAQGTIWVAGIAVTQRQDDGGISDWLLRQRRIVVRDAEISWLDEMRGAPQLGLKQVNLQVENRGERHRFGLRAVPPPHLAGPLDLRGDLRGDTVRVLSEWNGNMFVQLDYADIAAWRTWVPFPIEFPRGAGALRMWLGFSQNELQNIVADVRLADVKTRLAKDLPELDLSTLSGRVAWKSAAPGFEFSTTKLALKTPGGLVLQPVDFLMRVAGEDGRKPARGELQANALDFEPLVALADRLPLDAEFRQELVALAPRGSLYDIAVRWTGEWQRPSQYSMRGRFQDLALKPFRKIPGFSGISGNIDGNEKTGSLHLNTTVGAKLDMPLVFREPLQFEAFTAQLGWLRGDAGAELRMNSISFSNQDLAGTLFGSYRMPPAGGGVIDLTGNLTRADARNGSRYVPLVIGKSARDWLDRAFLAGRSNDVSLRIKGNLEHFPFADGKHGIFQIIAKVTDGVIDYGENWPKIENVAGELNFRGKRMDVFARQGTILGARLGKVHAEIPDLIHHEKFLQVTGEAEGPTGEFLSFIEKSPVNNMVDRFTEGMRAQGNGKLTLKLEIPLRAVAETKVTGSYQLINNAIISGDNLPSLEQVNGRVDFSESSVRVQNATGTFLGGPVTMSAATQRDSTVRGTMQGQVNFDSLRRAGVAPAWMLSLRGSAPWNGSFVLRKKLADIVLESNLQGVASDLPAPLVKSAAEAVALRIERRFSSREQDQIIVSYGDIVSANLQRRTEAGGSVIRRGNIRFGGVAPEPQRDGVSIAGSIKSLNLDRWLTLAAGGADGMRIEYSAIEIKVGELEALARRFNDVALSGVMQGGAWRTTLSGREFEGTATWQPEGRGKLSAQLKKLVIPPVIEAAAGALKTAAERKLDLPALDIVADQFQVKGKQLGKLELTAVPEARDWRIEKLRIASPDGTLAADGVWQNWQVQPRTQINLQLETTDIGKLLTRLGYPEGVRRGTAKLHGALAWPGSPQDFDYPLLSGNIVLEAAKGQFAKLEPGIGKLLGILSLQSLPRRISLDFRDVFSEGFAFDEIIGGANISRGVANTSNFRIRGPAANVVMTGDVDLAKETQKLHVKITPSISDAASVAGALIGGPIAGVAAFLAQKLLKDPLDQMASYEYDVTGTWADPQVSKVEKNSDQRPTQAQ